MVIFFRKLNNVLLDHLIHNVYKYFVKAKEPCDNHNREKFCLEITMRLVPDITSNLLTDQTDIDILKDQRSEVKINYK